MIWNVVESVNPWYGKPAPTTPFWFWIYDENHTKLYKFGMRKLRRKRLTGKFIETLVECYLGSNMGGANIVQFIDLSYVKKKYKVEI
jgi:hypothetical protein